jgi:2-hydroxy-3-oxopropionate reductase
MKTIGFIGLGLMGKPMAINLLKKGYELKVWNRTISKCNSLKKYGAQKCQDLKFLAKNSDIIITMVKDDQALIDIFEKKKLFKFIKKNSLIIDMSSTSLSLTLKYTKISKKNNFFFLDSPVSGGTIGAKKGNLAIMIGGCKSIYLKNKNIFRAIGKPTYLGKNGSGQIAKLANQTIVGITIGAVAEAILIAKSYKVNEKLLLKSLKGGFADSIILQLHGKRMIENNFKPGGFSNTQLKDLNNIYDIAKKNHLLLPLLIKVRKLYKGLIKKGYGHYDHSAIYKELLNINNIK